MEARVFACLSGVCLTFLSPTSVFAPNGCFLISTLLISQPYVGDWKDKGVSNEDSCKIETFLSEVANRGWAGRAVNAEGCRQADPLSLFNR